MRDPFASLRDELVRAADRAALPVPRPRRRDWLRRRSHPVAIVVAALLVCGTAAAAAVSLTASSSQPLTGRVPGTIEPASVAGYRYRITVSPNLYAGGAGWGSSITYSGGPGTGSGSSEGGGYPTRTDPVFGGSGISLIPAGGTRLRGDTVGFVLTGPQVAAVRFGERTIRTFTSPQLPTGDRAAVFFVPAGFPELTVGWLPGQPIRSSLPIPKLPGYKGPARIPTLAVLPLDRRRNVIPARPSNAYGSFYSFWQAPSAITPGNESQPYHGPTHPLHGVCELAAHGLPGLTPEWGQVIRVISPARDSIGELFLSCINTEYFLHRWPLVAAVLLDARRPGQSLGPIPGAKPVPGLPDIVDLEGGSLTARRIGNAWLVVQGGSGAAQRRQVLAALRISKLDLHRIGRGLGPH
jgi:hypothetical protein